MIELRDGQPARHFSPDRVRAFRALLQVERGASGADISAAFRAKVLEYHPDKVAALGKDLRDLAERKTKELSEAYHVLRDISDGKPRKAEVVFEAVDDEGSHESPAQPPPRSEPPTGETRHRPRGWVIAAAVAMFGFVLWKTGDIQPESGRSTALPRETVVPETPTPPRQTPPPPARAPQPAQPPPVTVGDGAVVRNPGWPGVTGLSVVVQNQSSSVVEAVRFRVEVRNSFGETVCPERPISAFVDSTPESKCKCEGEGTTSYICTVERLKIKANAKQRVGQCWLPACSKDPTKGTMTPMQVSFADDTVWRR
ncbi:MAG: DnaJ domain-containing protein [Candidatus Eisenbacteria bacterium]|nr:DnaJ domain-containing protein [Candidatus Eisenbacteria bacterium]